MDLSKGLYETERNPMERKDYIRLLFVSIAFIAVACIVNYTFFSNYKTSKLFADDEMIILDPDAELIRQGFFAHSDNVKGFNIYVQSNNPDDRLMVSLLDAETNDITAWEIGENVPRDGKVYLQLDDVSLKEDDFYYLYAWVPEGEKSDIKIIGGNDTRNGYGSEDEPGYVWRYQIVYDAMSSLIYIIEIIGIILIIVAYFAIKENVKLEIVLSFLFFVMALMFFLMTPINTVDEEASHFYRSYETASGQMIPEKNDSGMEKSAVPEVMQLGLVNITQTLDDDGACFIYKRQTDMLERFIDDVMVDVEYSDQSLYSPVSYLPQTIGLYIAKLCIKNAFLFYFYGRFFAFVFNLMLVLFAIKLFPERKGLIFAVAASPMFLTQMVSYSADGVVNSLAFFFVALVMHYTKKEKLSVRDKVILPIIGILVALAKVVYCPLVLLVLLIDNDRIADKKKGLLYKCSIIATSVLLSVMWFLVAKVHFFNGFMDFHLFRMGLGRGMLNLNGILWIPYALIIGFEFFTSSKEDTEKVCKSYFWIVLVSVILTVGFVLAGGIKIRYFVPVLLPLSLIMFRKKINISLQNKTLVESLVIITTIICTLINSYYIYV